MALANYNSIKNFYFMYSITVYNGYIPWLASCMLLYISLACIQYITRQQGISCNLIESDVYTNVGIESMWTWWWPKKHNEWGFRVTRWQTNHCVGSDNASLGVSCYLEGVLVSSPGTHPKGVYTAPNEAPQRYISGWILGTLSRRQSIISTSHCTTIKISEQHRYRYLWWHISL